MPIGVISTMTKFVILYSVSNPVADKCAVQSSHTSRLLSLPQRPLFSLARSLSRSDKAKEHLAFRYQSYHGTLNNLLSVKMTKVEGADFTP